MASYLMRTKPAALSVFTVAAITGWVVLCALGATFGANEWGLGFTWFVGLIVGAILLPSLALGFAAVIFLSPSVVSWSRRPLFVISAVLGCVLPLGAVGAGSIGEVLISKSGMAFTIGFIILSPLPIFIALFMCRKVGVLPTLDTGCCRGCGYDLRGRPGMACPECGSDAI